jgi:serine protease Do
VTILLCSAARAAEDLAALEERAIQAAVDRAAPCVVRIETVGGLERVERVLVGTGPTTGTIVSEDGYIISSAFNFVQKPASILVTLPDGNRVAAQLVATDHSRKLVLLKVSAPSKLPTAEFVPRGEIHAGQWAIAVGRTFEGSEPNVSVGIVSAVDRIWGRAIQTDAKISPSNYGGPLVDIAGRVLGILAPLKTDDNSDAAGVDWYDSGIGFAVPLEDIQHTLPRLKNGEDLYPGVLGVSLAGSDMFSLPAKLAAARPNSPAAKAGLKADDLIVELGGRKISRQTHLKHQLGPLYAGDKVRLVVMRGEQRLEREIELVDKLLPYERPALGLLPMRPIEGMTVADGVAVRDVLQDSPAAGAGLLRGDRIVTVDGAEVKDGAGLDSKLRDRLPGDEIKLQVKRGEQTIELPIKLGKTVGGVPRNLPPPREEVAPRDSAGAATGVVQIKVPEFGNDCIALVPENYTPQIQYGVVVWIHPQGGYKQDELLARWKDVCAQRDLILLAPKAADAARWQPSEGKFIRRCLDELMKSHKVDRQRIVVHGEQAGGAMAYLAPIANRDLVRGVVAVQAPMPSTLPPPEADPANRLAYFIAASSLDAPAIKATIAKLRELKHPVATEPIVSERSLNDREFANLVDWIDSLDRL